MEGNIGHPGISELLDLSSKTALVTGAAVGIGRAIAQRLTEAGAFVMAADINREEGARVVRETVASTNQMSFVEMDVASLDSIRNAVRFTVETFGSLDILVNNAGVFPFSPFDQTSEDLWDRVLDINLKGAFFAAQLSAMQMVRQGSGGRIINIASIDGIHPTGALVHYDASKGGMIMMTKALAKELGSQRVTVNAIAPGSITTPGAQATGASMMAAMKLTPEQAAAQGQAFNARVPLGRAGDPDEIARVVLFLASGLADYITGETIVVDGGYLLS